MEYYTYDMTEIERKLSRMDRQKAKSEFAGDPVGFLEWDIALQKAWINLVATDFSAALKERGKAGIDTMPCETQDFIYTGAVNRLGLLQGNLRRTTSREDLKSRQKAARKKP